jgi:hypothetical protein
VNSIKAGVSKEAALFSIFVLALLGAETIYLQSHGLNVISGYAEGGIYFWIWLALPLLASVFGFVGSYRILRTGVLNDTLMSTFLILICIDLELPGQTANPWIVSFNLGATFDDFGLGVNTVGIVLLSTYRGIVRVVRNEGSESDFTYSPPPSASVHEAPNSGDRPSARDQV